MRKTRITVALMFILATMSISPGFASDSVLVSSITAEEKSILLAPGTFWEIITYILPANASNQNLTWSSTDTKIADVDDQGVVTAKKVGNCSVVGRATDGSEKKVTLPVQVKEFDILVLKPGETTVDVELPSEEGFFMGVTERGPGMGSWKSTTVSENGCVERMSNYSVRPLKAGTDVLHVKVTNDNVTTRNIKYTVFVSQAAVREAGAVPSNETNGEILFRDIPWGSNYNEVVKILADRGETVKPLAVRKKMLWTQIKGEITFGNFTAFKNGLSFKSDNIETGNAKANWDNCSFTVGDYYFEPDIPFETLKQNLMRVYGLSANETTNSDTECVWHVDNVTVSMKKEKTYTLIKIACE